MLDRTSRAADWAACCVGSGRVRRPYGADPTRASLPGHESRAASTARSVFARSVSATVETEPTSDPSLSPAAMPRWVGRAIIWFWLGFATLWVLRGVFHSLRGFFITLLVSLFLSFAIEPAVNWMAAKGLRRGPATLLVFLAMILSTSVFTFAIGAVVVNEVQDFIEESSTYLDSIENWVNKTFDAKVDFDDLRQQIEESEGTNGFLEDAAGKALEFGLTALGVLFNLLTIGLFTFYLVADGPRLRRTICSRLPPHRQAQVLRGWELAIDKTGGYLYSRFLLAVISATAHWIAFTIIGVPYALALGVWVGVMSQFVPVIGTYLAGALAVLIGLLDDPWKGVFALAVAVVYQQVENYLLAPRVTAHTLSLHPAIAFAGVIIGAALLGPVGALLALPAAAVIQALISSFGERHDVIESDLLAEPAARASEHRAFRLTRKKV
jgi:predicted PurR-regulated permease PerM